VRRSRFPRRLIRGAVANLFELIEGAFGALIMVVAGLGALSQQQWVLTEQLLVCS